MAAGVFISQKVSMKLFLQKSISAQIRQLVLYHYVYTEYVDGFVRKLSFKKRPQSIFCVFCEISLLVLNAVGSGEWAVQGDDRVRGGAGTLASTLGTLARRRRGLSRFLPKSTIQLLN